MGRIACIVVAVGVAMPRPRGLSVCVDSSERGNSRASAADVMALLVTLSVSGALRRFGIAVLGAASLQACGPGGRSPGGGPPPGNAPAPAEGAPVARRGDLAAQSDLIRVFQGLGLLASGLPLPFTGSVATLAGATPDSTLVLVSLSFPTMAFSFIREADRFRATYSVAVEVRKDGGVVARSESNETVRVVSFKETQRIEESVLFQQQLLVPPGTYTIAVLVRDGATSRSSVQEKPLVVPRYGNRPSTPIIAVEATPRTTASAAPELLANARSTIVLGRDTELPLYIEARDSSPAGVPLQLAIRDDKGIALWRDSVVLPPHGGLASGVVRVPVARLGVGVVQAVVWRPGQADTVAQPVLISFGDDLPVASFDEMINYLRYFASGSRLSTLKTGTPQQRAEAWASFLRETDPISITPQNEALRDYFQRIRVANERFKEDAASGWLSDRGQTYVSFGEPDQIIIPNNQPQDLTIGQRGRIVIWEYASLRLRLIFVDQSGFGRWRFYNTSANEFATALQRQLNR
jgi:GWxTD domain-containing protein